MIASPRVRLFALCSSLLMPASMFGGCERASASATPEGQDQLPAPIFADRSADKCGSQSQVGESFEDFELPGLADSETVRLSDFRGRVVLLNFWGTWCAPCLEELPEFSALYRAYREHGLTLLAVSTDEDPAAVSDVAKHHQLTAHFAVAGEELAERQGEHDFPFTYLIDAEGRIGATWDGYDANCLGHVEEQVRRLLATQAPLADAQ